MRVEIGTLVFIAILALALPAQADAGSHDCTVRAGTELSTAQGPIAGSATSPAGGVGECHLHTLEDQARVATLTTEDGCAIWADTDDDAFVEELASTDTVYEPGSVFVAFCEAGTVMAENQLTLAAP